MLGISLKSTVVSLAILGFTLSSVVYAQTPTNAPAPKLTKVQKWCNRIVPRVTGLINNSSTILSNRQAWVAKRKTTVQNRINKYSLKGLNVTQVTSDFKTYSGMLDQWIKDYQTLITDLKATQQFDCGHANGQFAAAVKTANIQQKTVIADRKAFQSYFSKTLKVDFQNLAQQLRAMRLTGTPVPTH